MQPETGLFGTWLESKPQLEATARELASSLACSAEPILAHTHDSTHDEGSTRHYLFSVPPDAMPVQGDLEFEDVFWAPPRAGDDSLTQTLLAIVANRMHHLFNPAARGSEKIGTLGEAQPLTKGAEASAWTRAPGDPGARAAWHALIDADTAAASRLKDALRGADRGDGRMAEWAATIQSIRDWAHEIDFPPQGPPPLLPGT